MSRSGSDSSKEYERLPESYISPCCTYPRLPWYRLIEQPQGCDIIGFAKKLLTMLVLTLGGAKWFAPDAGTGQGDSTMAGPLRRRS